LGFQHTLPGPLHFPEGSIVDTPTRLQHRILGPVLQAVLAQATDPEIAQAGQYGATVSSLLVHLLESGEVQRALVAGRPRRTAPLRAARPVSLAGPRARSPGPHRADPRPAL